MTDAAHDCPICGRAGAPRRGASAREVCAECRARTTDAYGRRLRFSSAGAAGGVEAVYLDTGAPYRRRLCYIDGRKCFAGEHRFGGVFVEVVKDQL